jgi:pimeloyl-ACP methyl ester carboxylesterase
MHLAARHAETLDSLVLLDAGHTDLQDVAEWMESSLDERVAEFEQNTTYVFPDWDGFFAFARERTSAWRPALEARLRAGMTERDSGVAPRASNAAVGAAFDWVGVERPSEQLARLGELELPILLVVASGNDTSKQVARFQSAVPRATVVEVDSEHDLFAQAPEETARVVADWLLEQAL